jgi:serine/threonine-protein kinase RsbT
MLPLERLHDFETAVGEASMNAVQHGGGGKGHVHGDSETGVLQVWIEDQGEGIAEDFIHRAIEQGWTTGGFGQGFFLMRSCADRIYLLTGPNGTTVVLEQERTVPEPAWLK